MKASGGSGEYIFAQQRGRKLILSSLSPKILQIIRDLYLFLAFQHLPAPPLELRLCIFAKDLYEDVLEGIGSLDRMFKLSKDEFRMQGMCTPQFRVGVYWTASNSAGWITQPTRRVQMLARFLHSSRQNIVSLKA